MCIVIYAVSVTCEFYLGTSYVALYGQAEINKCKKNYNLIWNENIIQMLTSLFYYLTDLNSHLLLIKILK